MATLCSQGTRGPCQATSSPLALLPSSVKRVFVKTQVMKPTSPGTHWAYHLINNRSKASALSITLLT